MARSGHPGDPEIEEICNYLRGDTEKLIEEIETGATKAQIKRTMSSIRDDLKDLREELAL